MHISRDVNSHGLEGMKCRVWHTDGEEDNQKMKLYDNDYVQSYSLEYNSVDELGNGGYIHYAEVQVEGEASILGVMRTYLKASYDLCNKLTGYRDLSPVAIDPVTYIIKVDFKHWEEGEIKHGTWMVWNGGFDNYVYKKLYYKFPQAIKILNWDNIIIRSYDENNQEVSAEFIETYEDVITQAQLDLTPNDGSLNWEILAYCTYTDTNTHKKVTYR